MQRSWNRGWRLPCPIGLSILVWITNCYERDSGRWTFPPITRCFLGWSFTLPYLNKPIPHTFQDRNHYYAFSLLWVSLSADLHFSTSTATQIAPWLFHCITFPRPSCSGSIISRRFLYWLTTVYVYESSSKCIEFSAFRWGSRFSLGWASCADGSYVFLLGPPICYRKKE